MAKITQFPQLKAPDLTGGSVGSQRVSAPIFSSNTNLVSSLQAPHINPKPKISFPSIRPSIDRVGPVLDGKTLENFSHTIASSALKIADTVATRKAEQLVLDFQSEADKLLYDADNGYLQLDGEKAYLGREQVKEQVEEIYKDYLENSSEDVKAKAFFSLSKQKARTVHTIAAHASKQFDIWGEEQIALKETALFSSVEKTYFDSEITADKIMSGAKTIYPDNKYKRFDLINKTIQRVGLHAYLNNPKDPTIARNLISDLRNKQWDEKENYIDNLAIAKVIEQGEDEHYETSQRERQAEQLIEVEKYENIRNVVDKAALDNGNEYALGMLEGFRNSGQLRKDRYDSLVNDYSPDSNKEGDPIMYGEAMLEMDGATTKAERAAVELKYQAMGMPGRELKEVTKYGLQKSFKDSATKLKMSKSYIATKLMMGVHEKSGLVYQKAQEYAKFVIGDLEDELIDLSKSDLSFEQMNRKIDKYFENFNGLNTFTSHNIMEQSEEELLVLMDDLNSQEGNLEPGEYRQKWEAYNYNIQLRKHYKTMGVNVAEPKKESDNEPKTEDKGQSSVPFVPDMTGYFNKYTNSKPFIGKKLESFIPVIPNNQPKLPGLERYIETLTDTTTVPSAKKTIVKQWFPKVKPGEKINVEQIFPEGTELNEPGVREFIDDEFKGKKTLQEKEDISQILLQQLQDQIKLHESL